MRSLLHTYKMVKENDDNNTRTTSYHTQYMSDMEKIFGESYLAESDHILQIGIDSEEAFDISRRASDGPSQRGESSPLQDSSFSKPELDIKESPPSSPYSQTHLKYLLRPLLRHNFRRQQHYYLPK
ncbi:unnamed protein product [Ceratitis capitata]|uniref:(Mediterranean fruit fly) hypothetical protein n=1 Tax=Ceratitis capitata TaxID=7213 RepID=A0A811UTG5_CERCA|nr:unnamed protein product [Ceratitis capitata]